MDFKAIREEFPITRNYNFLNHASVAPLPRRAVAAVQDYLEHQAGNSYVRAGYRAFRSARQRGYDVATARLYAVFTTLGKFPEAQGSLRFWRLRLLGRRSGLIEHK